MSDMTSATAVSNEPPKRVLAAGLFGAFVVPKPVQPAAAANARTDDEFVDDFIAGTHAHPQWEVTPAP